MSSHTKSLRVLLSLFLEASHQDSPECLDLHELELLKKAFPKAKFPMTHQTLARLDFLSNVLEREVGLGARFTSNYSVLI